ncbi:hypothetical protein ACFIQG_21015 [Comamonas odontotermitis]
MTIFDYLLIAMYIAVGAAFYFVGRIDGYRRSVAEKCKPQAGKRGGA